MKDLWRVDEFESPVEKSQRRMALIFVTSVFLLSSLIFCLLIFEPAPLSYKNIPFPVQGGPYRGGDFVLYRFDRCNRESRELAYTIKTGLRNIEGNYLMDLGSTKVIVEPGCTSSISYTARIPNGLASGKYRFEGSSEIYGTVRLHIIYWNTETFIVLD